MKITVLWVCLFLLKVGEGGQVLRVLFVGNSFTYTGNTEQVGHNSTIQNARIYVNIDSPRK